MRDALVIPLNQKDSLVITSDNSGAIGMKTQDLVKVAYETVGYFSFRVAVMECLAAGGKPVAVIIQNFCGDKEWDELTVGVQKGIEELGIDGIEITGSTESNFPLVQSAVGLNVIGVKSRDDEKRKMKSSNIALIGLPLVGNEVIDYAEKVAPLSLFYQMSLFEDAYLWPVGSKGVGHELERVGIKGVSAEIDFQKSGGPATSFLVLYPSEREKDLKKLAGSYYHSLT
jgi:hypothetical protein